MEEETVGHKILIVQCDCGHLHSNLIACARNKVIDEIVVSRSSSNKETSEDMQSSVKETKSQNNDKAKSKLNNKVEKKCTIHVVFIVQLPRKSGGTNFVGFQGGDWLSVHLDDLRSPKENELSFQTAIQCSISDIFNSTYQSFTSTTLEQEIGTASLNQKLEPSNVEEELEPCEHSQYQSLSENVSQTLNVTTDKFQSGSFNANQRLRDLIQMACSWLYDTEQKRERTTERINILTDLIPTESTRG